MAKYAFIGLILAGLACVSTGLIGAAKGMIAAKMFPEIGDIAGLNLALQISAALLVVGLAAYAIMAPDAVRRFFTGRKARYVSNALILILAFVGIILVINYIVYQNPKSWDMTEDQSNTLADATLQTLATLPDKVTATAFYTASLNSASADDLLLRLKNNSGGKCEYKFVDPDLDPVAAREAGITGDGNTNKCQVGTRQRPTCALQSGPSQDGNYYWPLASRNPQIIKSTIRQSSSTLYDRIQYDICGTFQGESFTLRNVNYFFAYKGKWGDVHISIANPLPEDDSIFTTFDRTLNYGVGSQESKSN